MESGLEKKEIIKLYQSLGKFLKRANLVFILLTSVENSKAILVKSQKRKLYNGRIKVDYYQYFGPKPSN